MNCLQDSIKLDTEKIKELLLKNGVDGLMKTPGFQSLHADGRHHTKSSLDKQIKNIEEETKDIMPDDPFFSLFYNLDDGDFKAAYLYGPQFSNYLMMRNPQLENITNIGKGLTQLVPIPLVNIYEGKRWSLPRVQIYQRGEVVKESDLVGKETYSPDFEKQDELAFIERAKRYAGPFKEKIDSLFRNKALE